MRPIFENPQKFKQRIQSAEKIDGCIINSPLKTLAITLIDFDSKKAVNECLEISREPGDGRTKAVYVTVRGSGGGKTRSLEEMQRVLLLEEGVLSIAITFNNLWTYDCGKENWIEAKVKCRNLYHLISVIARMASVVFDVQFGAVKRLFHEELHSLDKSYQTKPDQLLRYFIRYMIERILPNRNINTFILLIDEVVLFETGLNKIFPENPSKDSGSDVRGALLDENLIVSDIRAVQQME